MTAVVSDVLQPYLDSLLANADENTELRRVMNFIERLASHPDESVRGLVATEIAYPLLGPGRNELLERARLFVGPATRELLGDQERLVESGHTSIAQRLVLALLGLRRVRVKHRGRRPDQSS